MKKTILLPLVLLAAMMLMATTACAHTTPTNKESVETATQQDSYPVADTIEVMSQAMGRTIKNVVVVPNEYFYNRIADDVRYPVLYLLHGAYGCYSDWSKKADLHRLANEYGVIIVCPDGQDSWYFDSPVDPKMQFETCEQGTGELYRQPLPHPCQPLHACDHRLEYGWPRCAVPRVQTS